MKEITKYLILLVLSANLYAQPTLERKTITEALNYTGDKSAVKKLIITDSWEQEKMDLLLEEYPNVDTVITIGNRSITSICNDYEWYESFNLGGISLYASIATFEGTDKDLFSYTTLPQLPADLSPNTILHIYNTFHSSNLINKEKIEFNASFNLTLTMFNGNIVVWTKMHTVNIVENIIAKPTLLNFGNIEINKTYTNNIILQNTWWLSSFSLKTGYLLKNTDFNLETNLDNIEMPFLENYNVILSVNSEAIGEITDTLIVITEDEFYCNDTLIIPLKANCVLGIEEDNIYDISVYPNPANNDFYIIFDSEAEQNISIELTDIEGKFIESIYDGIVGSGKQTYKININLISNVYFIKFTIKNKIIIKKTIIN